MLYSKISKEFCRPIPTANLACVQSQIPKFEANANPKFYPNHIELILISMQFFTLNLVTPFWISIYPNIHWLYWIIFVVHVKTIGTFNYSQNATMYLTLYDRGISWPWKSERLMDQPHHASAVCANSGLKFHSLFWFVCFCMAAHFYFGK